MSKKPKKAFRIIFLACGAIGLIMLILFMGGFFASDRIGPERVRGRPEQAFQPERTVRASIQKITEYYHAVGTVRPHTETRIEAQISGKILKILVRPGDNVSKGDTMVLLDSRESQARLDRARHGLISATARKEHARQGIIAAQAGFAEAESSFRRIKRYFDSEAATAQDLEQAESDFLQAKARLGQAGDALKEAAAGVRQAEKVVEESKIALGYTKIVAPEQGEVAKRLSEPGDLAWPGKPLLVLQTRGDLRLEALVREGLIHRVSPGTQVQVVVDALSKTLNGKVEEMVPSADPMTRTFLVKVGLPDEKGLFPGMFGRLKVPVKHEEVVVAPKGAIKRIGQLEVVRIKTQGKWQQVFVKTGREIGAMVEILSGLKGDETLALEGGNHA